MTRVHPPNSQHYLLGFLDEQGLLCYSSQALQVGSGEGEAFTYRIQVGEDLLDCPFRNLPPLQDLSHSLFVCL